MTRRPLAVVFARWCSPAAPATPRSAGTSTSPAGSSSASSASTSSPSTATPPTSTSAAAPSSDSTPPTTTQEVPPVSTAPTAPVRNPALDQQLIDAAWANDVELARQLIAGGADVNAKDDTVQSAYLIATSEGYLDLLELTLANGADLTSLDSYNGTGLIRAAERGHADIVGRLLQAGIEVNHVNRPEWTALDEAIVYGDGGPGYVDTVRALVAGGADVTRIAGDGRTPLQHAEAGGFQTIASTLAAAVESSPLTVEQASGLLLSAAENGDADAVVVALRAGAPIESRDGRGRTALLLASAADQVDVARLLVALGGRPGRPGRPAGQRLAGHRSDRKRSDARDVVAGAPGSGPAQPVRWGVGDPRQRARACRLRPTGGQHRHRREPRQRPRLDRDAGGDRPGRRIGAATRRSSGSCSTPVPTRPSPTPVG